MKPMTVTELKKELKKLDQVELIELIKGLYLLYGTEFTHDDSL